MPTLHTPRDSYRVSTLHLKAIRSQLSSGVFITFSGNCRKALTFYQSCFGGRLTFETFDKKFPGFTEIPVVSGSLISDNIIIHGSDLVYNEGRKIGNYLSVFLLFENVCDRKALLERLKSKNNGPTAGNYDDQELIEVTDAFDVRWVLGCPQNL
jgi:PhnB protein